GAVRSSGTGTPNRESNCFDAASDSIAGPSAPPRGDLPAGTTENYALVAGDRGPRRVRARACLRDPPSTNGVTAAPGSKGTWEERSQGWFATPKSSRRSSSSRASSPTRRSTTPRRSQVRAALRERRCTTRTSPAGACSHCRCPTLPVLVAQHALEQLAGVRARQLVTDLVR